MGERKPPGSRRLAAIWGDETGVSAPEYAIIAALVALVVIGIVSPLGANLGMLFSTVARTIEAQPFFCREENGPETDCTRNARRPGPKDDASLAPRPCPEGGHCS